MTVSIGLGPNFFTCSGLGWVSQLMGWVGLGRVTQNGPMDNSGETAKIGIGSLQISSSLLSTDFTKTARPTLPTPRILRTITDLRPRKFLSKIFQFCCLFFLLCALD